MPFSNFTQDERDWLTLYGTLQDKLRTFVYAKVMAIGGDKCFVGKTLPHKPYRNKDRKPEERADSGTW